MANTQQEGALNNNVFAAGDNELTQLIQAKQLYNKQATHHFFVGDETTVELFNALKEIVLKDGYEYFGVLELHPEYEAVLTMLKLLVDRVPELPGKPAQNAIQWMEEMHPNCWKAWQHATYYLSGGAPLINTFRQYLLQKNVNSKQIRIINL
jgi:hypothetical protein